MSEKLENLLNLSLEVSAGTRQKSMVLNSGFDEQEKTWEIIVRFSGDPLKLQMEFPDSGIIFLQEGYLIMEVTREELKRLTSMTEVIYVEMPKALHYQVNNGRSVSCINSLQIGICDESDPAFSAGIGGEDNLTGQGVLLAILDSGIDYSHPDFRKEDGTTRIAALWDQTLKAREDRGERPPDGFPYGVEFDEDRINLALQALTETEKREICPSVDISGHGTHVAGIAGGNGRASGGKYKGMACGSEYLIVKLGNAKEEGFPRTTQLMTAVTYCLRKSRQMGKPVVMNISIGNNYGSHAGDSLLETYINEVCNQWKCNIIVGVGNEGAASTHTGGFFQETDQVELFVGAYETGLNVQLWKQYADVIEMELVSASGDVIGRMDGPGSYVFAWGKTDIYVYFGLPSPYSVYQEIFFDFVPEEGYVEEGILLFRFYAKRIVSGVFDMWLPAGGILNIQTGFAYPTPDTTITIPSAAVRAISVGAYDSRTGEYAAFSGRGFTWETRQVKPDLVAPGVNITSCAPGGGYGTRSGTSMAAPFVAGGAAVLMEWGIVRGNDPYLYGEKMKAGLIRGAKSLFSEGPAVQDSLPSKKVGWGRLCVADVIMTRDYSTNR